LSNFSLADITPQNVYEMGSRPQCSQRSSISIEHTAKDFS
jgi:hypothetical protein